MRLLRISDWLTEVMHHVQILLTNPSNSLIIYMGITAVFSKIIQLSDINWRNEEKVPALLRTNSDRCAYFLCKGEVEKFWIRKRPPLLLSSARVERENVSFLAIGRPEAAGCYCKVNAYLKEVIGRIADSFDYVIIDGEAGIEQVNRRVMEKVTHLILVSDASRKGLMVVSTIHAVAQDLTMFEKAGLIVNRIPDPSLRDRLDTGGVPLLSCIGDDRTMAMSDFMGNSVFSLNPDAPICRGVEEALIKQEIIKEGSLE